MQAVVAYPGNLGKMTTILCYAHRQHHAIVDALLNGQAARVEALMREHVAPMKEGLSLLKERISRNGEPESSAEMAFAHLAKLVTASSTSE